MGRPGVLTLAAAVAVLVACQGPERPPTSSPGRTTQPTAAAAGQCRPVEAGDVQAEAVLVPGPGNGLPQSPSRGEALVIVGAVLDARCGPAADASLRLWHTDARGAYGPAEGECCYYQGNVRTDRNGRFRLETIRPGRYAEGNAPPAHIHLEIRHESGALDTEIVFVGDPGVPTAPVGGYAPVTLRRAGEGHRSWYGESTLVLGPPGSPR